MENRFDLRNLRSALVEFEDETNNISGHWFTSSWYGEPALNLKLDWAIPTEKMVFD